MNGPEPAKNGGEYVGYDYKTVIADNEKASIYMDAYQNFGWTRDESVPPKREDDAVELRLKRDRKILNKAELTRLQQHFEACMDEIITLEYSKTKKAGAVSIAAGILGTAFLAGSVFAVTNEPPMILLCVLLGIPGIAGWALPYRLFKALAKRRAGEIAPLIEQKYDEIHQICESGNALVH